MTTDPRISTPYSWLDHESQLAIEEIHRVAQWTDAFPRDVENVIPLALPITIVSIPNLRASYANNWFMSRGRDQRFDADQRPLHGCFLGYRDTGFIFVDSQDEPDERRYTIAHEVGHFLLDHMMPRRRAIVRFGPSIKEVMDGDRKPTIAESFRSIIEGIPIGQHVNLMERRAGGGNALELYDSENRADRIAIALLAPPEVVMGYTLDRTLSQEGLMELLVEIFGLPPEVASQYATVLLARSRAHTSPYDRLART